MDAVIWSVEDEYDVVGKTVMTRSVESVVEGFIERRRRRAATY